MPWSTLVSRGRWRPENITGDELTQYKYALESYAGTAWATVPITSKKLSRAETLLKVSPRYWSITISLYVIFKFPSDYYRSVMKIKDWPIKMHHYYKLCMQCIATKHSQSLMILQLSTVRPNMWSNNYSEMAMGIDQNRKDKVQPVTLEDNVTINFPTHVM